MSLNVFIEGNAGVGKSSCTSLLKEKYLAIPEYTENMDQGRLKGVIEFVNHDWNDDPDIWTQGEHERLFIRGLVPSSTFVFDTSLISVVLFAFAAKLLLKKGSARRLLCKYIDEIQGDRIIVPDFIFLLHCEEGCRQDRIKRRGSCHPMLADSSVNEFLFNHKMVFLNQLNDLCNYSVIDTTNISAEEVACTVSAAMDRLDSSRLTSLRSEAKDAYLSWLVELQEADF